MSGFTGTRRNLVFNPPISIDIGVLTLRSYRVTWSAGIQSVSAVL